MVNQVRFILKEPNANKESLIYAILNVNGKRLKLSTGLKVNPKAWQHGSQRVKSSHNKAIIMNERLRNISHDIEAAVLHLINNRVNPTPQAIKEHLLTVANSDDSASKSIFDYFEEFIEVKKTSVTLGTIDTYFFCRNHLRKFASLYHRKITFDSIDDEFYVAFHKYLWQTAKLNDNSSGKIIKNLKVFLRWATKRGINNNKDFLDFKVYSTDSDQIALSAQELHSIHNLDLSDSPHLSNARDLFLILCYTGLRYSDLANLTPTNIKGNYLYIYTVKTRDQLIIPIVNPLREIIDKLIKKGLHMISVQKLNDYIKQIAKTAGITEKVQKVTFRGPNRKVTEHPKYELMASHTGRRTFITLSLEKGMRPEVLRQVTGHTTLRLLEKYIKITDKVAENELMNAWNKF
jgi:site-specific recombinase XerD